MTGAAMGSCESRGVSMLALRFSIDLYLLPGGPVVKSLEYSGAGAVVLQLQKGARVRIIVAFRYGSIAILLTMAMSHTKTF